MKMSFSCTQDYDDQPTHETVCTTTAESLPDVLEAFTSFLRGCGFYFEGEVAILEEDDYERDDG